MVKWHKDKDLISRVRMLSEESGSGWSGVEWSRPVAVRAIRAEAQENKSGVSLFSGVANEGND